MSTACSLHFDKCCSLQNKYRRFLKKNAIPTIFIERIKSVSVHIFIKFTLVQFVQFVKHLFFYRLYKNNGYLVNKICSFKLFYVPNFIFILFLKSKTVYPERHTTPVSQNNSVTENSACKNILHFKRTLAKVKSFSHSFKIYFSCNK